MTRPDLERVRREADRLGFNVSEDLLERCMNDAAALGKTATDLDNGTSVEVTTSPDVTARGDHDELLATYESPRQERHSGPLAGTRVVIKDNISARGLPMTCGSDQAAVVSETDAAVTERLLDHGARLVGKANMDAFAFGPSGEFSDYGTVTNPLDADRVPGGSSAGSGAAIAAGTADLALGTDTGGSIRIPAACCGLVGTKPTHGLVPRHGFVSFAPSLDTIGPLARDTETAFRGLNAIAGVDPRDPSKLSRNLDTSGDWLTLGDGATVGLPCDFFDLSNNVVAEAVRSAVKSTNLQVKTIELPLGQIEQAYFLIGATEFVWFFDQTGVIRGQGPEYTNAVHAFISCVKSADLGDHVARRLLGSATLDTETDGEAYRAARQEATAFTQRVGDIFNDVDALVMPTIRTIPPERGEMDTTEDMLTLLGNTAPFNISGNPATTVPVTEVDGLPVSAQVVAPWFEDLTTLAIADRLHDESAGA
ncbi:MAG: amidase [Natronomonas sp.]|uniref:amidase n=1 Tax=Natronomonas sp. TaxID=2184060 RepID=UPI00286FBD22|nr:amidase [Natronomonas sp.]MDR9431041.1 amidase [Natronomonas sp.]